jgi:hypothetical protein
MQRLLVLLVLVLVAALGPAPSPASAAGLGRLDFGVQDPLDFEEPDPAGAYDAAKNEGIRLVRIPVEWNAVAPTKPRDQKDPSDPAYRWGRTDRSVQYTTDRGLEPDLVLYAPPRWARPGSSGVGRLTTSPATYARFATAAARRYRGRVAHWELWNEPNLRLAFEDTPEHYRAMANAAYKALHAVSGSNVVIAGALAPFSGPDASHGVRPLTFMARMLCVSAGARPHATCHKRSWFDVWAHHPYTNGGPNHKAFNRGDVSVGDLPQMRRVLDAAQRAGHIESAGGRPAGFWVTEFSWDTNPPDPGGISPALEARWAAEAFYRMWQSRIGLILWFMMRDNPDDPSNWGSTFQSGLYFRTTFLFANEREKPVALVVRFPFVALPEGRRVVVWGRAPSGHRASVVVERRSGDAWKRVRTLRTGAHGIFRATVGVRKGTVLRGRVGPGSTSTPFRAVRTRDRTASAFGGSAPP